MDQGRKLAFLYPGQGAQRVGMGAGLQEAEPKLFDRFIGSAERVSGLPLRSYLLEGSQESLTRTDVAQPAMLAFSLALTEVAQRGGLEPELVAGHSLGEYTAAVAGGALSFEDGIRLVVERGRLMQRANSARPGAMAAVRGLEAAALEDLCRAGTGEGVVGVANLNSPRQVVVSGDEAAVEQLLERLPEGGGVRGIRLRVGAAFHSELMTSVQARLRRRIATIDFRDLEVPMVANWTGQLITDADDVREALIKQTVSPVRWMDCVQTLLAAGSQVLVEIGPSRVLSSLARDIDADAEVVAIRTPSDVGELAPAAVSGASP